MKISIFQDNKETKQELQGVDAGMIFAVIDFCLRDQQKNSGYNQHYDAFRLFFDSDDFFIKAFETDHRGICIVNLSKNKVLTYNNYSYALENFNIHVKIFDQLDDLVISERNLPWP